MELIKIVKGEDKEIAIKIINISTGDPFDLTNKVLTGVLKASSGPNVIIPNSAFVILDALLGKIKMTLGDAVTTLLAPGPASFEIVMVEGPDIKIVQFQNVLEIKARI